MHVPRDPANTASKFDVIYIFRFKIQRVQKNYFEIVYIIQIIDISRIYGSIEQYTSCFISFCHIIDRTRCIAAYASTSIS